MLFRFDHDHVKLTGVLLTDCGIRPATSAEAEFLQDYIRKSNNNAAQQSVNAARIASEQAEATGRGEERSDEDDEDDSDAQSSGNASKRNSLNLGNGIKNVVDFPDEKTPTAATLLSQAQGTQRPTSASFPPQASIRRHTQPPEGPLTVSQHPSPSEENKASLPFMPASGSLSVRQMVHFPSIEEALGANSTSPHAVLAREVWGWFQDHLDSLLDGIRGFRFDQFEVHIRSFWSTLSPQHREVIHAPIVAGLMAKADAIVYDVCINRRDSFDWWSSSNHFTQPFDRKFSSSSGHRCYRPSLQSQLPAFVILPTRWRRSCSFPWRDTVPLSWNPRSSLALDLAILSVSAPI